MAEVAGQTHIRLFKELKQRFPEVPDNVLTDVMKLNFNVKERCIEVLSQESNKYLYGDGGSSSILPTCSGHKKQANHSAQSNSVQESFTSNLAKIHISATSHVPAIDHQRRPSLGPSVPYELQQRKDCAEISVGQTRIGTAIAGKPYDKPTATATENHDSTHHVMPSLSSAQFTTVHQVFVESDKNLANELHPNTDINLEVSKYRSDYPLQVQQPNMYTNSSNTSGSTKPKMLQHMPNMSFGIFDHQKINPTQNVQPYVTTTEASGSPLKSYPSSVYPMQQSPMPGSSVPKYEWVLSTNALPQETVVRASRPLQFLQNLPTNYSQTRSSPSPQHHYPTSNSSFASPKQEYMSSSTHGSLTSPHNTGYKNQQGDSPLVGSLNIYPPASTSLQQNQYISHIKFMLDPRSAGAVDKPHSPNNPSDIFHLPNQKKVTTPGSGSNSNTTTPTNPCPQQMFNPNYNMPHWLSEGPEAKVQNPLMLPSPDMAHAIHQPMQPIPSPSSSHGSFTGTDTSGTVGHGNGRTIRSGSIPGVEDIAYTQALILHQKAGMERLLKDLREGQKCLASLRSEVKEKEKQYLDWRKQKASSFPSALDVHRMKEENSRLQIDIKLMTTEIDMVNNGRTPLGVIDPGELQNFYKNIGTGQRGSIHASAPTSLDTVVTTHCTTSTASSTNRQPPPRPPPPTHAYIGAASTSPSSHPPAPPHLVSMTSTSNPQEQPPPYSEQPEVDEGENWSCSACSFLNHPALDHCELCEMPRINTGPR